jgi:hypothetical protein
MKRLTISRTLILRWGLVLVFVLSYLVFFQELEPITQAIPVFTFLAVAGLALLRPGAVRKTSAEDRLSAYFLLAVVPVLTLASSALSERDITLRYWALLTSTLVAARIIGRSMPMRDVLHAFASAGQISIGILLVFGFDELVRPGRLAAFELTPNLISFLAAGFGFAQLAAPRRNVFQKALVIATIGICAWFVYAATSRGTVVAVVVSVILACFLRFYKRGFTTKRMLVGSITGTSLLLASLIVPLGPVYDFIDEHLELSSPYRGLDTGLTGRIAVWRSVLEVLKDGSWLSGNGLRSTDQIAYDINTVDNGYLVLLYEAGVVPAIGICLLYLTHTSRVIRNYLRSRDTEDSRGLMALVLVTIAFFTNNLTARYLFGMGNPYSLMMLVFLAAPRLSPTESGAGTQEAQERHMRHKIRSSGVCLGLFAAFLCLLCSGFLPLGKAND